MAVDSTRVKVGDRLVYDGHECIVIHKTEKTALLEAPPERTEGPGSATSFAASWGSPKLEFLDEPGFHCPHCGEGIANKEIYRYTCSRAGRSRSRKKVEAARANAKIMNRKRKKQG